MKTIPFLTSALFVLFVANPLCADTLTLPDGTTLNSVYVSAIGDNYYVADPATGTVTPYPRQGATLTQSPDRAKLKAAYDRERERTRELSGERERTRELTPPPPFIPPTTANQEPITTNQEPRTIRGTYTYAKRAAVARVHDQLIQAEIQDQLYREAIQAENNRAAALARQAAAADAQAQADAALADAMLLEALRPQPPIIITQPGPAYNSGDYVTDQINLDNQQRQTTALEGINRALKPFNYY